MVHTLVLLRHGESEWNAKNLFTGWVDVDLTDKGRAEAVDGGEQLVAAGLLPDVVHTSLQRRAITTAHLALDAADRHWIPVHRSWRLNERHYGALQGKDKKQTLEQYGEEQFMTWRRSFDVPPPPLDDDDEFSQAHDPRYADLGDELPRTECLKDVIARMLPYWESAVVPDLRAGRTVLVAAHGNSLRGDREAPRRHQRRGHPRPQHPHRHAAGLPARRVDGPHRRRRRVPRPRGGRRGRRRGRQPGSLSVPLVHIDSVPGSARAPNRCGPARPLTQPIRCGRRSGGRQPGRAGGPVVGGQHVGRGCRSCSAAATGSRSRCTSRGRRAARSSAAICSSRRPRQCARDPGPVGAGRRTSARAASRAPRGSRRSVRPTLRRRPDEGQSPQRPRARTAVARPASVTP